MPLKINKSFIASAVLLLISVGFVSGTIKMAQKSRRLIEAKEELKLLQQQKTAFEQEALYRSSPEFVEQEARNKLNMVKIGEDVYLKPKISGDDLLGAEDSQEEAKEGKGGFFAPVTAKIDRLFDNVRDLLILFQN